MDQLYKSIVEYSNSMQQEELEVQLGDRFLEIEIKSYVESLYSVGGL